jgi:hypothetical protein
MNLTIPSGARLRRATTRGFRAAAWIDCRAEARRDEGVHIASICPRQMGYGKSPWRVPVMTIRLLNVDHAEDTESMAHVLQSK